MTDDKADVRAAIAKLDRAIDALSRRRRESAIRAAKEARRRLLDERVADLLPAITKRVRKKLLNEARAFATDPTVVRTFETKRPRIFGLIKPRTTNRA